MSAWVNGRVSKWVGEWVYVINGFSEWVSAWEWVDVGWWVSECGWESEWMWLIEWVSERLTDLVSQDCVSQLLLATQSVGG